MKLKLTILVFLFVSPMVLSQNQANIWYFGYGAGIDFNSGTPVSISGGQINAYEGCATQCDPASGQLLFYTDGITVWDNNHTQMPNGFGLFGDYYSSASALIVPKPATTSLYYIFTTSGTFSMGPNTTLHYSVVDLSLNSGLGDVTTKNILLLNPSTEKLTAVYHCNGVDVWVVAHQLNSNSFYAYLVTSSGISAPVVSSVGGIHTIGKGYMKASPNGKKIGLTANSMGGGLVELFDFDNSSGVVSNPISLPPDPCNYGVSFSPDNSKFYVTGFEWCSLEELYQYDISSGIAAIIIASKTYIATGIWFGALQNAPDGKMYVALDFNNLGVINNPNALGLACNYVSAGFNVGPNMSSHGLPYFIESYFNATPFTFTITTTPSICGFNNGTASVNNVTGGSPPYTYTWGTTPPQTTQIATGLATGTYTVNVADSSGCISGTQTVTIVQQGFTVNPAQNNVTCFGSNDGWTSVIPSGGNPPYTYLWSTNPPQTTQSISNLPQGSYTVNITDSIGCTQTQTFVITQPSVLSASVTTTNSTCNTSNGTASVNASGGTGVYTYLWNPSGQNTQTATGLAQGTYTIIVTDGNGCTYLTTAVITSVNSSPTVTANPPDSICYRQDSTQLNVTSNPPGQSYSWSPLIGLSNPNIANPWASPSQSMTLYCVCYRHIRMCGRRDCCCYCKSCACNCRHRRKCNDLPGPVGSA